MQSKHGSLESLILSVLWDLEKDGVYTNCVKDVFEILARDNSEKRAYTTVKTVMDRLFEKKILSRYKWGSKYCYKTLHSADDTVEQILNETAKRYLNGDLNKLSQIVNSMANEKNLVGV